MALKRANLLNVLNGVLGPLSGWMAQSPDDRWNFPFETLDKGALFRAMLTHKRDLLCYMVMRQTTCLSHVCAMQIIRSFLFFGLEPKFLIWP